jgi:hypothetical protein
LLCNVVVACSYSTTADVFVSAVESSQLRTYETTLGTKIMLRVSVGSISAHAKHRKSIQYASVVETARRFFSKRKSLLASGFAFLPKALQALQCSDTIIVLFRISGKRKGSKYLSGQWSLWKRR